MIKISTVNRELRKIDPDAQLCRADGYLYFAYGIAEFFDCQPVTSKALNSKTLQWWVDIFNKRIESLRKYDPSDIVGNTNKEYVAMRRKRFSEEWPTRFNALRLGRMAAVRR